MINKYKNYLLFLILCLIWGTTWAAIKIGLEGTPPTVGLALRFFVAAFTLFIVIKLTGRKIKLSKQLIKLYLIVGVFNMALSYFCTYWGTQFIPSSLSSILWSTLPILTGLMAHFMIKGEQLNRRRIISIIISTIGVILILSDQKLIFDGRVLLGSLVVVLAVFFGSFPSIYVKKYNDSYDPIVLTAIAMGFAAIFHTITSLIFGQWSLMKWDSRNVVTVLYLGIFGSAITFSIYFYLLQKVSVVKLSFITFVTPISALLIGWGLLNEVITLKELIGVSIIFLGIILYDFNKYFKFLISYRKK